MGRHFIPPLDGEPQTARSIGMGPAWADLADVVDLASLAAGRRRHAYRMAADAVDHLIALMDALDADGEDIEPASDDDACFLEIWGEGDAMEDAEDGGDAEPSLGAPERHPEPPSSGYCGRWGAYVDRSSDASQTHWASGSRNDREVNIVDQPHDDDELDDDGLSRGEGDTADWEATAPERHGCGFVCCGPDDAEEGHDAEGEYEQGSDDDPFPWGFQRPDAAWRAAQIAEAHHG